MFKNNLKIAWRHLTKDRQFTFLNIVGLSVGLACSLLIWLWVDDELSFDRFFKNDDRLFQLMERRTNNGQSGNSDESSGLLSETVKREVPEVEYAAALAPPEWYQKFTLSVKDKNIKAIGQYAGQDYFNIFSFEFIEGNRDQVLKDKNSIVISDELARNLFNSTENVIGKTIRFQQEKDFAVSGIFKKLPYHSSTQFDFVLSFEYLKDTQGWVGQWNNIGPHNFVLLRKGTDINSFNKKIADVITRNGGDSTRKAFVKLFSGNYLKGFSDTGGRIEYVRLFSLIAIFILVIACINFMNLSTAKASQRMKEVGVKKVVGAGRRQLVLQFLTESLLVTSFAMALAIGVAWLLLPQFNQITGKEISLVFKPTLIIAIICVTTVTGLLAGSYPALYLSGFNPIKILKGKFQSSYTENLSRKGLVVFQFTLSAILIISVLVIYKQVQYIQGTNLGYNKDNVIRFNTEGRLMGTEETFISELKRIPGIVNAGVTSHVLVGRNHGDYGIEWTGKEPNESVYFESFGVGYNLIETMNIKMIAGRSFTKNFGNEQTKIILNESALKVMQLKDPIGKTISLYRKPLQIIGIAKDFHFESLHEPIKPSYITLIPDSSPRYKIVARINAAHQTETIAQVKKLYESYNPGFPFDYTFLDEFYQKQYLTETRVGVLSGYFAGLAIVISCLGLFGLVTFTAHRRQKEIGIRKVVGASVQNITAMLSKDFLMLVLIAVFIAFPISWWAMSRWLQTFVYHVTLGPQVFIVAGLSILLITIITISFQAIKAAIANPVKSLKAE